MGHKGNRRVYIYIYSFWWKLFFGQCDPLFPKWKCAERRIEKRGKGGWKDGWWRRRLSEIIKWRAKFDWD